MDPQPASYDPNRIPASVFARNSTSAPIEWSATSNESMFSFHDSFSIDSSFTLPPPQINNNIPPEINTTLSTQTRSTAKDDAQPSTRSSFSSNATGSHVSSTASFVFPILAAHKARSESFEACSNNEKHSSPVPQQMTKQPSRTQPKDPEPQTSAESAKCGWLNRFSWRCCRFC